MSVIRLVAIAWWSPPCTFSGLRFPSDGCNRHLRIRTFLANNKQSTTKKTFVCERKRCSATCGRIVTDARHECKKVYFANCKQNTDVGLLCYMKSLKDVLPDASDKVLYVFYDLKPRKIQSTPRKPHFTYLISSAFSSFVRSAKMRKIVVKSACDAVRGSTRSGTIRWGSCYYTYGSHAYGPIRLSRSHITPRRSS